MHKENALVMNKENIYNEMSFIFWKVLLKIAKYISNDITDKNYIG